MQATTITNQQNNTAQIALALLWFTLATIITGWFISQKFWLYSSVNLMILSGAIAGAKWVVQIIAALVFLKTDKWQFIKRIGLVCFIGSVVLLSYNLLGFLPLSGWYQFLLSIVASIIVMLVLYYRAVKSSGLQIRWFWGWAACLLIAITLQTLVVF